jgi:hypothetical protein
VIAGNHTIATPLALADSTTADIAAGSRLTITSDITASAGVDLSKQGPGTLEAKNLRLDSLIIDTGTIQVTANGSATGLSVINSLTVAPTAQLDLADNDLVVNDAPFSTMQAMVLAGFGASTAITSSTSDGSQILALFDNAQVGATDWMGLAIGPNAIVGKYTYFGDVNIDGQVTGDDYTVIDANLNTSPPEGLGWLSGDANLDGAVTGDDYTVIDANLGAGVGSPLAPSRIISAVPEPAAASVLALAAAMLSPAATIENPPAENISVAPAV